MVLSVGVEDSLSCEFGWVVVYEVSSPPTSLLDVAMVTWRFWSVNCVKSNVEAEFEVPERN